MATWEFGTNDAETVKLWSEAVARDAEKPMFWAPAMYSLDGGNAVRHPDAMKGQGIIKVHTDFQSKKGDAITLHNVGQVFGRGVHGDGLLRDTGANLDTYTMSLKFEDIAMQVRTSGPMSERRTVLDFRQNGKIELGKWALRKSEEAIVLALWGLTAPNNASTAIRNFDSSESAVFGNTIQAFDSDHIVYAGDATSVATIDSADVMSAQLLTKLETKAFEELAIPLDPLNLGGEEALVLFCSNKAVEQLLTDEDFVKAQRASKQDVSNPLIKRAIGKFGRIYVVPYARCLNPAANVSRAILCGANALQMAKVDDWTWFEDFEDTRKRRKVISVGAALGVAPTYFNSSRRNAIAVDHYVR